MEVITSHTNADFDTLASMLAAKKLYPQARIVFPGSLERKLREGLERLSLPFEIEKADDIDLDRITRLILVDVRQASRIGPFSKVARKEGVEIHIYDHHPPTDEDLHGPMEVVRPHGSTTAVLTELIQERNIKLTSGEATILMAGIYEDTGFLSYPSTTAADFRAAAFLLESGADLSAVSDLLKRELTAEEVSLLDELLKSLTEYSVGGINVAVAEASIERYSGDISALAHMIIEIKGMATLFMLIDSGDRIHIVARSRDPALDAGRVMRALGGGGHPYAASATLKGVTLIQAREKLLSELKKVVTPVKKASDIMSFPAITVTPSTTVEEAASIIGRYNINAAPVVEDDRPVGIITRQTVDRALRHRLGSSPVEDFMTVDFDCVDYDESVDSVRERLIGYGQRILPVIKDGVVRGVITRTDILKLLQEELKEVPGAPKREKNLKKVMKEALPDWLYETLVEMGRVAEETGCRAYVVGGFVRDLLMKRKNLDVDVVIEGGDGIEFARRFASLKGLRTRSHRRFGTAVVIFPDGFKIDVATARLEYYERPGALPTVEQSSLKLDLYRRDFIINTLAVELNPRRFGSLIDFFGARRDIKEKRIRVLHNLSFVEDPTRALRAVRFAEKFNFRIEAHTLNLIKKAVKLDVFRHVSGPRILEELKNILEEDSAVKAVRMLYELGLLAAVHRGLVWNREVESLLEGARKALDWFRLLYTEEKVEGWLVLFLALTDSLDRATLMELSESLSITGRHEKEVLEARDRGLEALRRLEAGEVHKKSGVYELLYSLPLEVVLYIMARAEKEGTRKAISTYITRLRPVKTILRGDDLKALGVPEGPEVGRILREILRARLDGVVRTREDELALARDLMARGGSKRKKAKG